MKEKAYYTELLKKYANAELNPAEEKELFEELARNKDDKEWEQLIQESLVDSTGDSAYEPGQWEAMVTNILQRKQTARIRSISPMRRWLPYAAAIVVVLGSAAFLYNHWSVRQTIATVDHAISFQNEALPGANKAVLTLSDGSTITLDSASNGHIAKQEGSIIQKTATGGIIYQPDVNAASRPEVYNTMSTPRGSQYQLTLVDGTKVWLNAASSITYPVAFNGNQRKVKVTGEVYFEVEKNKQKPFVVDINGKSSVEVLGTHFNVNSYADEGSIKTTLLEGSIRVVANDKAVVIHPGQQATIPVSAQANNIEVIDDADIEKIMAWKNGLFQYRGADIQSVMREFSRWYDVDIVYTENIKDLFYAEIPRHIKLSSALKALEQTGKVHFTIDRKQITVIP